MPAWARAVPMAVYVVILLTAYNFIRDTQGRKFTRLSEIIRIPGIYYFLMLVAWLIIVMITQFQRMYAARKTDEAKKGDKASGSHRLSIGKEVILVMGVVFTYVICVFLSWIFEYLDWKVNLIVLTMIYCFSFMLVAAIGGSFLLAMLIPMKNRGSQHTNSESSKL